MEWCSVATIGKCLGRKRLCSHVFTCTTVAQLGGLGALTVHGAYSARNGSQVISAFIPCSFRPFTKRSVNTSVPVPVRTVGNQMAGFLLMPKLQFINQGWNDRLQRFKHGVRNFPKSFCNKTARFFNLKSYSRCGDTNIFKCKLSLA